MVDIRTARGQSERGGPAFGLTDPRRRQATSLFSRADQTSVIRPNPGAMPGRTSPHEPRHPHVRNSPGGPFPTNRPSILAGAGSIAPESATVSGGPVRKNGKAAGWRGVAAGWVGLRPNGTGLFRRRAQAPRRLAKSRLARAEKESCDKAKSRNLSSLGLPGAVTIPVAHHSGALPALSAGRLHPALPANPGRPSARRAGLTA